MKKKVFYQEKTINELFIFKIICEILNLQDIIKSIRKVDVIKTKNLKCNININWL